MKKVTGWKGGLSPDDPTAPGGSGPLAPGPLMVPEVEDDLIRERNVLLDKWQEMYTSLKDFQQEIYQSSEGE